jgi:hypothetical protein
MSNPSDVSDLLKPRVKCIAPYPGMNNRKVGDIIEWIEGLHGPQDLWLGVYGEYPHLFKPLQWWEERGIDEMPEYVKCIWENKLIGIYKIQKWEIENRRGLISQTQVISISEGVEPATENEYLKYVNNDPGRK